MRLLWMVLFNLILLCVFPLFPLSVYAAFENVGISARPMGMGGAYAALVSDTSAIIWNPAGLAKLNEPEIGLNYLDLYGLVDYSFIAWARPLQIGRTVGAGLSSSSDPQGLYQELIIDFSVAEAIRKNLYAGLNVKYLSSAASIDEISVGSGRGGAIDLGIQYTSMDKHIVVGLHFQTCSRTFAITGQNLKMPKPQVTVNDLYENHASVLRSDWISSLSGFPKQPLPSRW